VHTILWTNFLKFVLVISQEVIKGVGKHHVWSLVNYGNFFKGHFFEINCFFRLCFWFKFNLNSKFVLHDCSKLYILSSLTVFTTKCSFNMHEFKVGRNTKIINIFLENV